MAKLLAQAVRRCDTQFTFGLIRSIMSLSVVYLVLLAVASRPGLAASHGHCGQCDHGIVADRGDGFQAHVA
ncbi:MAG: hypothetical protein ACK5XB_16970, partial [Rhodospirillales bacterium]